ncbi:MAG: energy-dependent translational throttle protein EttA [Solirubrobacteraceae bacterium]|nr:energy-dependent translational throttle protein EttA [Solirubrobacteraceae bacterium]
MAPTFVFQMHKFSKVHPPDTTVLKDLTLSFLYGAKIGVLGPNGAGKSTILKVMAGIDQDFRGDANLTAGVSVGYLEQEPELDETKDVRGNVEDGLAEIRDLMARFNELAANYSEETADEFAKLQDQIEAVDGWNLDQKLDQAMDALRCPPGDSSVAGLSGGEKRRVALARLLLSAPDLLLLDEPTNHLDAESVSWLEQHLADYAGTVVAVTHDRYFLDNVANWILELDRGNGYPYEGNYTTYLEAKAKRMAAEQRTDKNRQRAIDNELEWVRKTPKGRQTKSKARLKNFQELVDQQENVQLDDVKIHIPVADRLGNEVIELSHVQKAYGDKLLFDDLSFKLPPGGIVGIIGPNGAGKTTLFKLMTGNEQPDAGEIKTGPTVKTSFVDQSRDSLDPELSVWQTISGGLDQMIVGKQVINSRQYCSTFNFKGARQQQKVGTLSGGQRNRLHLAKQLAEGGNLLLLDEPTNDLDTETLRALEDAILNFAGCAVIISHDRFFLDKVCTHVLAFRGNSETVWFEGNFQAYEEYREDVLGEDITRPHRIAYKKLAR